MSTDMYGCAKLHYDVADELVKGVDLNQKLTNGDSVLHDACNKAMPASIVKYPLQKGVDVNCRNSSDYTPLVCVARTAHQFSDSDICKQVMTLLVEAGADVNVRFDNGQTLLMYMMMMMMNNPILNKGYNVLVQFGGDLNAVSPDGHPVLWTATFNDCFLKPGCYLVEHLLAWNIDITISKHQLKRYNPASTCI